LDAYEIKDGRHLSEVIGGAGVDGLVALVGPVPEGKTWTIFAGELFPSVNETRTVFFAIRARSTNYFSISVPVAIALTLTRGYPLVTQGMELKLFPGESLYAFRDVATAGSNFYIRIRYIETDLPYFSYEEPLNKVVRTSQKHSSLLRGGGGGGGGGGIGGGGRPEGGGRGGPQPI
jgi:uncharacterized membrane protein YgcG